MDTIFTFGTAYSLFKNILFSFMKKKLSALKLSPVKDMAGRAFGCHICVQQR
jgi:hypothetical protein